ncbi:hypothetical protein ACQKGO_27250 [Corallococcus interemptor]|uniref:hypothetical protein n=1 Tax=Corallococcus interemptor TaxID=2316720 RepID=UPI003CFDB0BE
MLARATALLFLGLGMASCGTKEPGPEETVPRLDVLRERAWMLGVDARQRFLVFTSQTASGTYAQALPAGWVTRISEPAEGVRFAQDGSSVLLWSPVSGEQTRTWWIWRPGTGAGVAFTSRASGDMVHDRSLTYAAFTESEAGTTSLRVMDTATCTAEACPLRTLLQVPGNTLLLQGGGTAVLATDATQGWLIDVPSGAVTPLGPIAGPTTLSSDGTRYSLFDGAGHLQVFDTATRTLVWERPWMEDVSLKDWKVSSALMTDAKVMVVNVYQPPPPGSIPLVRETLKCDAEACQAVPGGAGACWWGLDRTDAVHCNRTVRCGPYGCEYQDVYYDASMRLLSNTGYRGSFSRQPAFNADLTQHLWLDRGTSSDTLTWNRPEGSRQLALQGRVETNLCAFLPGGERVAFAQALTRSDGVSETRLWAWDGETVTNLLPLENAPTSPFVVRDSPTALYVNVAAPDHTNIIRIGL